MVTVDIFPLILQGLNGNNSPFVLHPCLDADLSGEGAELSWPQLGLFSRPGKGNQSHLPILPSTPLHPCPRTGLGVGNQELFTPKSTSNISSVADDPSPVRGGTCLDPGIHSGRFGSPRAWSVGKRLNFFVFSGILWQFRDKWTQMKPSSGKTWERPEGIFLCGTSWWPHPLGNLPPWESRDSPVGSDPEELTSRAIKSRESHLPRNP